MRTGADYRETLSKDGRNVWVFGEGRVDDVTTHPATAGMVDEYVRWYDRHFDPEWQDLLTYGDGGGRQPVAFKIPRNSDDLRRLGKAVTSVHFTTGGNMTHTPGYGALISLGILDTVTGMKISEAEIANAAAYRDMLAETGRFLTFSSGAAPIGFRFREDESERAALRLVRETDAGYVISGKTSMHTSTPFAEDVFVSGGTRLDPNSEKRSWFIVPVAAPGLRVVCRRMAARSANRFLSPMSSRFDELDAQIWLDEVFVPYERVFTSDAQYGAFGTVTQDNSLDASRNRATSIAGWLFWHQHYGWLAKAEFSLGLALAIAQVMSLKENAATLEQITDLIVDVQTARSCITAAELDPDVSRAGFAMPGQLHVASASLYTLRARQRVAEILRGLPGSSLVIAPADTDFEDADMARELEQAFGGGDYTAKQRAALLQLAWDHVSSGLDGREAVYEMHANGGVTAWRNRMRAIFDSYNDLANGVLDIAGIEGPPVDLAGLRNIPMGGRVPRQPTVPQTEAKPDKST